MATNPNARSVKIGEDERGGWSSDRPRRGNAPPRPDDISVRCRVLKPSHELRYSPGSLLLIASASADARERLAERAVESAGAILSLPKVHRLLAGKLGEDQAAARAPELLDAAVAKRLESNESVALVTDGLDPAERERYARMAAKLRRPRHLVLVEAGRDEVADDDRAALNELRRRLDAGELGAEGFQTALRLGGAAPSDLKRIVFRPEPRDD
jgi:hypothetical protein